MIHEVDEALRRLVRDEALAGSTVEVALEAPTREWSARRNAPTVNLYLYDIREDLRRRQRGQVDQRGADGRVTSRMPPPRYMKLSYLVTAWTQRPEDEHRLLSTLLAGLLRWEAMPGRLLTGGLAALGLPVPMTVAQPPPEDRSFADVWTALGGELKPSLDLVISAPIEAAEPAPAGPPVTTGLRLEVSAGVPDEDSGDAPAVPDEPVSHQVSAEPGSPGQGMRRSRVAIRRVRP